MGFQRNLKIFISPGG